jgi:hypothetical protein
MAFNHFGYTLCIVVKRTNLIMIIAEKVEPAKRSKTVSRLGVILVRRYSKLK